MEVAKKIRLTRKKIGGFSCIAKFCNTKYYANAKKASFFSLPSEPKSLKRWLINSRRYDILELLKKPNSNFKITSYRMCSLHFESSEFRSGIRRPRLIKSAIPTLFSLSKPLKIGQHGFDLKKDFMENFRTAKGKEITSCNNLPGYMVTRLEYQMKIAEKEMENKELQKEHMDEIKTNIKKETEENFDFTRVKTEKTSIQVFDGLQEVEEEANFDLSRVKTEVSSIEVFDGIRDIQEEQGTRVNAVNLSSLQSYNENPLHLTKLEKENSGSDIFKCTECDECYSQEYQLIVHFRTHTGEKPFICEYCDTGFVSRTSCEDHVYYSHLRIKRHKCEVCNSRFARKGTLTIHARTHSGEKPYKCKECGKSFAQHNTLNCHVRSHTNEKPFKCDLCNRSFAHKNSLTYHKSCHTGDKPFKCTECDKSYYTNACLVIHVRTHTGEKPFACQYCDKCFVSRSNFKKHVDSYHIGNTNKLKFSNSDFPDNN